MHGRGEEGRGARALTEGVRTVAMVGLNEMAEKNLLKMTRTASGLCLSSSSEMVEACAPIMDRS